MAEVYLFELKDTVNVEQSLRNLQDSVTTVKAHKVHKVVDDTVVGKVEFSNASSCTNGYENA